jgi:Flp pilus assembly protein TadD
MTTCNQRRWRRLPDVGGALIASSLGAAIAAVTTGIAPAAPAPPPSDAPLAVSSGAAPGYVPDARCALCHAALYRSYQEVGMARSFFRPRDDNRIEDFTTAPLYHAPSRQWMQIVRRGDRLVFRRWQAGDDGRPLHTFEVEVDWVLGSGHHARTYLYRTPDGALFQLPLAWYSQEGRWGMAPGYDRPDHDGVLRRVRRECLFCHNAYPEAPAGSDAANAAQTFSSELPEGTGCQRCHGPGAEHVRRALGGIDVRDSIRAAIVNPAKLAPALRDDVCNQCHLLPAVALPGARRLLRGDYSFRPGEALAGYQAHVDTTEEGAAPADRFEIDHQAYRLRQSRCFTASGGNAATGEIAGRLSCLTCHDPHRRLTADEKEARFRAACLTCHEANACKRQRGESPVGAVSGAMPAADRSDCAGCHMPKRRPSDVVHTVMTDHRIQRQPGGPEWLAPRAESEPVLTGVSLYDPASLAAGSASELYRTLPVVRTGASDDAVVHLAKLLAGPALPAGELEDAARLELAAGLLRRRRYAEAQPLLNDLVSRHPNDAAARQWLGIADEGTGKLKEAEEALRAALALPGAERAEVASRLGQLLARQGRNEEATALFQQALAIRPNLAAAWYQLSLAQAALGQAQEAAASRERAVAIDPTLANPSAPRTPEAPGPH